MEDLQNTKKNTTQKYQSKQASKQAKGGAILDPLDYIERLDGGGHQYKILRIQNFHIILVYIVMFFYLFLIHIVNIIKYCYILKKYKDIIYNIVQGSNYKL